MPLTINLLHEQQLLLKQRQRDPLKLGIYALVGVALLFVAYYGWRILAASSVEAELRGKHAEWVKAEPKAKAAEAQEKELSTQVAAAEIVGKRVEGRFYFAPLLESLLRSVPANVQIVNFTGNNDLKGDRIGLTLEGIVAGDVPRLAADQFRTAFTDSLNKSYKGVETSFRSLEESAMPVSVQGKSSATAHFTIEVKLNKPVAPPAPK